MQRPIAKPITRSANRIAPSAIARAIPSMLLDFARQQYIMGGVGIQPTHRAFSDLITFTRSSGGGRFNAAGQYEWLPANTPRIDYDPVTGECKGLLIEEQRTNLARYSDNYGYGSGWATSNCNLVSRAAVAPDGKAMAAYVAPSGVSNSYLVRVSGQLAANTTYTLSIYAKADKARTLTFEFMTSHWVDGGSAGKGEFNTLGMTTTSTGAKVEPVGNGWYRLSVTRTTTATPASIIVMYIDFYGSGIAGNGLYLWGMQIEQGAFATSPIPTPATFTGRASTGTYFDADGVLKIAAAGEARYTHAYIDGKWVSAGLLLEGQSTNLLTYSSDFANAAWTKASVTVTGGVSSPDGGSGASRVQTTGANATSPSRAVSDLTAAGATYTYSVWLRSDTPQSLLFQVPNPSYGTYLATKTVSVTQIWQRFDITFTGQAGALWIRASDTGTVYDIWGAQLEVGSFPTSYIPTTTAQVTRAADTSTSSQVTRAADIASVNELSPWYRQDEGTLFVGASTFGNRPAWVYAQVWDGTTSNRIGIASVRGRGVSAVVNTGGTPQVATVGSDSAQIRAALAYRANDVSISRNGAVPEVDASVALPANLTQLAIGLSSGADTFLNGHIRSVKYFPRRLSDIELQELTA